MRSAEPPRALVLDAEAFSALAAGERHMLPWVVAALQADSPIYVSAVTLVEVADGTGRDVGVRRAAKSVAFVHVTPEIGYLAGRLRVSALTGRRKPRDLTVDAIVAATALSVPESVTILTSDPGDLELLLAGTPVQIRTIR